LTNLRYKLWMGVAALLAAALTAGCEKKPEARKAETEAPAPATTTAERGPVAITVTADPAEFSIADRLHVTVTVEAEQQVEVEMPELAEMPGFELMDYDRTGPQVTAEGRNRWQQSYELEVYFSGEYTIPSFTVKFLDKRPEHLDAKSEADNQPAEPEWNELQTDELKVTATSLVQAGEDAPEELTQIEDIIGPVPLPREPFVKRHALLLGISGGVVLVAAAAAVFLRRKREAKKRMVPAHVTAYRMLEWLIAQDYVGKGLLDEFYVHLCSIVRRYIEMRFEIHAPEETTEEFLAHLSQPGDAGPCPGEPRGEGSSESLLVEHRALLKEFLEHADLVKFARHTPTDEEIQRSFDAAKVFIEATADDTVVVEAAVVEGAA